MLLLSLALAQTWAPVGTTWQYVVKTKRYNSPYNYHYCTTDTWTLKVVSDTVILGKLCRHIKGYIGQVVDYWLYEENGRIYYYNASMQNFLLLYDFNVGVDSYWVRGVSDTVWVDWIDTIVVNGRVLKRLFVRERGIAGTLISPVIEHIGGYRFLFPLTVSWDVCVDGVLPLRLLCYEDSSWGRWGNCKTSKMTLWQSSVPIAIYPNPFSDEVRVYFGGWRGYLEIYDVMGRRCYRGILYHGANWLDVSFLPEGVYYFRVYSAGRHYSSTLIKKE